MAIYEVTNVYTYTTTVKVKACSAREAQELAKELDGEHNNNDSLYDSVVMGYTATKDEE